MFSILFLVPLLSLAILSEAFVCKNNFSLCYIAQYSDIDTEGTLHGYFTFHSILNKSNFSASGLHFNYHILSKNGNPSIYEASTVVQENNDVCDVFLGPPTSPFSVSLSSMIQKLWVSDTASATDLSDDYAFFSRIILSDADGAEALLHFFLHYGYKKASILASDTVYGRSVAGAFFTRFIGMGGVIDIFKMLSPTASRAEAAQVVSEIRSGIIVNVMGTTDPILWKLNDIFNTEKVYLKRLLVYSEAACTTTAFLPLGSFCATLQITEHALMAEYLSEWNSKNETEYRVIQDLHGLKNLTNLSAFGPSSAMTHDAVMVVLESLFAAFVSNSSCLSDAPLDHVAILRNSTGIRGLTGLIEFLPSGDRNSGNYSFYNVQPSNVLKEFARWDKQAGFLLNNEGASSPSSLLYWLKGFRPPPDEVELGNDYDISMCYIYQASEEVTTIALHGWMTTKYMQRNLSFSANLTFNYTMLSFHGNPSASLAVRSIFDSPSNCDIYFGPSTSLFSVAVSPIVERPWIAESASSLLLSDKRVHPWFSRVAPTDDLGGTAMAMILDLLEFYSATVLCTEEPYGRSVAQGFAEGFAKLGGRVIATSCFQTAETEEVVTATLHGYSENRIIVVASLNSVPVHQTILDAIVKLQYHKSHLFIFAEAACNPSGITFPGAFCVSPAIDTTRAEEYLTQEWRPQVESLGWLLRRFDVTPVNLSNVVDAFSVYMALEHDAVRFVMTTLTEAYQKNVSLLATWKKNPSVLLALLRNATMEGVTGPISLDSNGDRVGSTFELINVQTQQMNFVPFATWSELRTENNGVILTQDIVNGLYWGTSGFGSKPAFIPPTEYHPPAWLISTAIGFGFLILIIIYLVFQLHKLDEEAFKRAVRSGIGFNVIQITSKTAQLVTYLLTTLEIATGDDFAYKVAISVLFAIAFSCSLVALIRRIMFLLRQVSDRPFDVAARVTWDHQIRVINIACLFLQDTPFALITASSLAFHKYSFIVLFTFGISCLIIGHNLSNIKLLLQELLNKDELKNKDVAMMQQVEISQLLSGFRNARRGGNIFTLSDAFISDEEHVLRRLHSDSEPYECEAVAAWIKKRFPGRYDVIQAVVESTMVEFRKRGITHNEFFGCVRPYNALLFDSIDIAEEFIDRLKVLVSRRNLKMMKKKQEREAEEDETTEKNNNDDPTGMGNTLQLTAIDDITKAPPALKRWLKKAKLKTVLRNIDPDTQEELGRSAMEAMNVEDARPELWMRESMQIFPTVTTGLKDEPQGQNTATATTTTTSFNLEEARNVKQLVALHFLAPDDDIEDFFNATLLRPKEEWRIGDHCGQFPSPRPPMVIEEKDFEIVPQSSQTGK